MPPESVATAIAPAPRSSSAKGVEFSDQLIVLGGPSPPPSCEQSSVLPKAPVVVRRGCVAQAEMSADPCSDPPLKPRSLSEHFELTRVAEEASVPQVNAAPLLQLHIPPGDVVLRPPGKRRARFYSDEILRRGLEDEACAPTPADDEQVETSCTDSDAEGGEGAPVPRPNVSVEYGTVESEQLFQECTRINTKLNSMPSGGTFSFMNSSEDVNSERERVSSESESSTDDEDLRSSRKMIRVDGSAKLSSASGLADDDFLVEDDEFGIEGAEMVEEEEAIQVRSFGRSFARVSLKDGEDVIIPDPRRKDKPRSEVAFTVPEDGIRRSSSARTADRPRDTEGPDPGAPGSKLDFGTSRSDPPRRKSRIWITFTKRSSTANSVRNAERKSMDRKSVDRTSLARKSVDQAFATEQMEPDVELSSNSDMETMVMVSCFPTRKTTLLRQRTKSTKVDAVPGVAIQGAPERKSKSGWLGRKTAKDVGELVAIPDMSEVAKGRKRNPSPERKIVKNVSLQHDDWIDFATNAARGQRHPWFVRVLSNNRASSSSPKPTKPAAAQTDPALFARRKSKRFWQRFGRKAK